NSHINSCDRTIDGTDGGAFYATNPQYATLSGTAAGRDLLVDSLKGLFVYTCTAPTTKSYAGFGQINWHLSSAATITTGLRVTHENKNNYYSKYVGTDSVLAGDIAAGSFGATPAQISAAQAIRNG